MPGRRERPCFPSFERLFVTLVISCGWLLIASDRPRLFVHVNWTTTCQKERGEHLGTHTKQTRRVRTITATSDENSLRASGTFSCLSDEEDQCRASRTETPFGSFEVYRDVTRADVLKPKPCRHMGTWAKSSRRKRGRNVNVRAAL
eukprot:6269516-Pyramimonas_sp.AAC.1